MRENVEGKVECVCVCPSEPVCVRCRARDMVGEQQSKSCWDRRLAASDSALREGLV